MNLNLNFGANKAPFFDVDKLHDTPVIDSCDNIAAIIRASTASIYFVFG